MNFYQGVVFEYLRSDRSLFINTECCIQLNEGKNPDTSGPHWYCDALACDFRHESAFLCEITYSASLSALISRLTDWHESWPLLKEALRRDSHVPIGWPIRPWLFVPEQSIPRLLNRLADIRPSDDALFTPRITPLEMVQPWRYRSWNRDGEAEKPASIPEMMQR